MSRSGRRREKYVERKAKIITDAIDATHGKTAADQGYLHALASLGIL